MPITPRGRWCTRADVSTGSAPCAPPRAQELRRRVPVVARLDGDVQHFLERVDARLARLELDEVEDLLRVRDARGRGSAGARRRAPRRAARAHSACASRAAAQAASTSAGAALGHLRQQGAGERRLDRRLLGGRGDGGARREAREHRRAHARRPLSLRRRRRPRPPPAPLPGSAWSASWSLQPRAGGRQRRLSRLSSYMLLVGAFDELLQGRLLARAPSRSSRC